MLDVKKFVGELHDYIERALSPLVGRLKALEDRAPERGEKGDAGRDADPVDVDAVADAVVAKLLASDRIATLADLAATKAVEEHFEAHPVQHGKDGAQGQQGDRGEKGDPGKDGVGYAGEFIDRDGNLTLTKENGQVTKLGVVVGRDGKDGADGRDGKDGRDGLPFDKCVGEFDPDRGYVLRFTAGDSVSEHVLPYMRHGGFWSEGKAAKAGESMTHDGALYIAKRETTAKPCVENKDDWIIAARKGRDGKDGRNGVDKTAAVKVDGNA